MKFRLDTSGSLYEPEKAARLEALGFRFEPDPREPGARLYKPLELNLDVTTEIATLEELVEFTRKWGRVVLSEGEIEIYDDYREH